MHDRFETTSDNVIFQDISKYLRVTDVLTPFGGLEKAPIDLVDQAAARGTRVHKICEGIIQGLPAMDLDDEVKPYIDSFMQWWEPGRKVIEIEKRFFDDDLNLTGQVDLIVEEPDNEGLSIIDLKTCYRPSKTWPLQGSAYAYLARKNGFNIKYIKFLHLNREGKAAKEIVYEDQWEFYCKCLDVYKYFFMKKPRKSKAA